MPRKKIISAEIFFEYDEFPFMRTKIALDLDNDKIGTIVRDGRRVICLSGRWLILKAVQQGKMKI